MKLTAFMTMTIASTDSAKLTQLETTIWPPNGMK